MSIDPLFRMTVQDAFAIRGRGTVVTGTIEAGSIHLGDTVSYRREGVFKQAKVSGLEALRKIIPEAQEGDTVGILLAGVEPKEIQRGDVLVGSEIDFGG